MSFGIPFVVGVIILILIFGIFFCSKKGKEFVSDKILGIELEKAEEEEDADESKHMSGHSNEVNNKTNRRIGENNEKTTPVPVNFPGKIPRLLITVSFCLLAVVSLSITAVVVFQGCILANQRILPEDDCPEKPMDCFVFNGSSYIPMTETKTFRCDPKNDTQFPSGLSNATAMCYGWVYLYQSTKEVLDQLGVCSGLIGLFTSLLAIIIYLGKSIKTCIISTLFIVCSSVAISLLVVFKWSLSLLTHAVLALGLALGTFGWILYCGLPKKKKSSKENKTNSSNLNERNSPTSNVSYSRTRIPPTYNQFARQTARVNPV